MGGHTYYSFSIEPEKLLKLAYVLHRNEANSDMMPTYQRIIKKDVYKRQEKGHSAEENQVSSTSGSRWIWAEPHWAQTVGSVRETVMWPQSSQYHTGI